MNEENTLDESQVAPAEEETSEEQVADTEESATESEEVDDQETEDQSNETQGERLYAGKYKTVEELEKGYENAQSLLGKRAEPQAVPEPLQAKPLPNQDDVLASLADENGQIDPMKLIEHTKAQAKEEMRNEQRAKDFEKQDWDEALKEFPELAQNPTLANIVKNERLSRIVSGQGYVPYKDMAKEIVTVFASKEKEGREKGREEAQVSERVVERSSLVEPNNNADSGVTEEQELQKDMKSLDHEVARKARIKYLEKFN